MRIYKLVKTGGNHKVSLSNIFYFYKLLFIFESDPIEERRDDFYMHLCSYEHCNIFDYLFNITVEIIDDDNHLYEDKHWEINESTEKIRINIFQYIWLVLTRKTYQTDKYYWFSGFGWSIDKPSFLDYLFCCVLEIHDGVDVRTDDWDNDPWQKSVNIFHLLFLYITGRMLPKDNFPDIQEVNLNYCDMTKKELIELLEKVPDDARILVEVTGDSDSCVSSVTDITSTANSVYFEVDVTGLYH